MKKNIIITALLALISMTGQAQGKVHYRLIHRRSYRYRKGLYSRYESPSWGNHRFRQH